MELIISSCVLGEYVINTMLVEGCYSSLIYQWDGSSIGNLLEIEDSGSAEWIAVRNHMFLIEKYSKL